VHAGGQAVVGMGRDPGGWESSKIRGSTRCKADCPCISARDVERGRAAGARASRRQCRTVDAGCTAGPGAPRGNRNALKHGRYTAEAIASRRYVSALIRAAREAPIHQASPSGLESR
jgi:glucans biosynthesis protein